MSQLFNTSVETLFEWLTLSNEWIPDRQQRITKMIAVPTSEDVAQIVGKAGSKIKKLRAATNTSIRTPLRGDDPVFIVSGTEANVDKVILAIKQASEHFTRIKESRSKACAVGEVTIEVPVPLQYIGAVVGRRGSVITKIIRETGTRINSPKGYSFSHTPTFEVTGTQFNVMAAKKAIEDTVHHALMVKESAVIDLEVNVEHKNEDINWPIKELMAQTSTSLHCNNDMNGEDSHIFFNQFNE